MSSEFQIRSFGRCEPRRRRQRHARSQSKPNQTTAESRLHREAHHKAGRGTRAPGPLTGGRTDICSANNGRAIWTGAELSSAWNVGCPAGSRHAPPPVHYAGQPRPPSSCVAACTTDVRACDLSSMRTNMTMHTQSLTVYRYLLL